jgi:hypothetical protein
VCRPGICCGQLENLNVAVREKEGRDESSFFREKDLCEMQVSEAWQGFAGDLPEPKAQTAARLGSLQGIFNPGRYIPFVGNAAGGFVGLGGFYGTYCRRRSADPKAG